MERNVAHQSQPRSCSRTERVSVVRGDRVRVMVRLRVRIGGADFQWEKYLWTENNNISP